MVALVNHARHPLSERVANNCGGHITDPLLGKSLDLLGVLRVVLEAISELFKEVGDAMNSQGLVLGNVDCLDLVLLDTYTNM